jgi:putative DNA primase/helicase
LSFKKTYKRNADPSQGELEADPRFKDDENFILEGIAPAMLNKMLERLPLLLTEGIDYKATREAMREAQEESRHLWQFAREVGLEVQAGGRVWVTDLWQRLQDWYVESGILEIEDSGEKKKPKLIWNELSNRYDSPVKAVNQLYARLCEIFPKIQIHRYNGRDEVGKKGQKYLLGISLVNNPTETDKTGLPGLPVDGASVTGLPTELPKNSGNSVGNSQTLIESAGNPGNSIFSPFAEVCNLLSQLTDSERQKLAKMLTPVETVKVEKGLRVRYIGTKYAEQLAGLELVVHTINLYREITCTKPDGSFTTWLSPKDLTAD